MSVPVPMTLEEFAGYADPPVTVKQLSAFIGALPGFQPTGYRAKDGPGRRKAEYAAEDLMTLHASIARWL